jgi:hypothetical protein
MRFRSIPVTVEAFRLTEENGDKLAAWCGGTWHQTSKPGYQSAMRFDSHGTHFATVGDWIIKTRFGFELCKPDVFRMRYETAPRLVKVCGSDCHPGDGVCNNYCGNDRTKPMSDNPPPGEDAEEYKGFRM